MNLIFNAKVCFFFCLTDGTITTSLTLHLNYFTKIVTFFKPQNLFLLKFC